MPKKPLRLHWSRSKPNFGDALSPMLCERLYGGPIAYARIRQCDLVAQGSILHRKKEGLLTRPIVVWGTGLIAEAKPARSKHHYVAVRGHETRRCIRHLDATIPLGDPGLLVARLLDPPPEPRRHRIGLICHYEDKGNPTVARLCDRYPDVVEIDIFAPVDQILRTIRSCEVIFSSAMHGLIAADALGIPNGWIKLSDHVRGDGFKFRDYYSVFDMTATPFRLDEDLLTRKVVEIVDRYERKGLADIQDRLMKCFPF